MHVDRLNPSRRGIARATVIRISVLSVLFIGVVIFGWLSRPDLVRNYLGIMAPAKNAEQAMLFANEDLFAVAADLAEAQVTLGMGGRSLMRNMDSQGAKEKKVSKETLENNPKETATRILAGIEQSRRDIYRAKSIVKKDKALSVEGINVMFKNIDLCKQTFVSLEAIAGTKLGEELARGKAMEFLQDTSQALDQIRNDVDSAPRR